jgi:hypothetical protein
LIVLVAVGAVQVALVAVAQVLLVAATEAHLRQARLVEPLTQVVVAVALDRQQMVRQAALASLLSKSPTRLLRHSLVV